MSEIAELFEHLNNQQIPYVVAGGLAVVLHGHPRFTADVDLAIRLDRDSILRTMAALGQLGFVPRLPVKAEDLADESIREGWVREKGMKVFPLFRQSNPLYGVDLFVDQRIAFERLFLNSVEKLLGKIPIRVCSIQDLIEMKEEAGRAKDLEDIRVLRSLADV